MKKQHIFFGALVFLAFWLNAGLVLVKIMGFMYPKIVGFEVIGKSLLAMLLPLGLSLVLLFRCNKMNNDSKIPLAAVTAGLIICSFFYSSFCAPFYEVISATDDIKNYLRIDGWYSDTLYMFPEKIPESSTDRSYHYIYEDSEPFFDTDLYVTAKWNLPKDEYEAEKARVFSQYPGGVENFNKQSQLTGYFISNVESFTLIFSYSDESHTVQYVLEDLSGHSEYVKGYERNKNEVKLFLADWL